MDYSNYKILYYDMSIIVKDDIIWGLLEMGCDVERSTIKAHLDEVIDEEIEGIASEVEKYDYVISQNFSVNISEACYKKNKPYISWLYDSPLVSTYRDCVKYSTNFIFAFDKKQVERIRANGCSQVFYQPLAANMAITSMLNITDEDIERFQSEVSFVGKIYNQEFYNSFILDLPDSVKKDIDRLYANVACNWKKGVTPLGFLSEDTIEYMNKSVDKSYIGKYSIDKRFLCELLLMIQPLAGYERKELLKMSGKYFETAFYTNSPKEILQDLEQIKICPPVSQKDEVYKVFFASKINVNLTLRSIESGIPQRVFDIMSVGGTVFSNYQEELEELFVPNKDLVLFHSLDEFVDKAKYYLAHDDERVRIGINGYYRVRDEYNYVNSLTKMFEVVKGYM